MTVTARLTDQATRHWRAIVVVIWIAACGWFLWQRWGAIYWFALGDTDDNLRLLQVRAWLNGQNWYDLRQYKLDSPRGADIHWSRLIDLPLAALILAGRLFTTPIGAEKFAVAVAPLFPLLVTIGATALTIRRLIGGASFILAAILLLLCQSTMSMYMPLRIDHHGWQLACVAAIVAGLADLDGRRGGLTVGIASAVSLTIGLEMIPYVALGGGALALRWIGDAHQAVRLRSYGLAMAAGVAIGYLAFASYANAAPRCDALTPVWTSAMAGAGGLLAALSVLPFATVLPRLVAAQMAGAVLIAGLAFGAPQCLGRPEVMSDELIALWFTNIREVKPLYEQSAVVLIGGCAAYIGVIGAIVATLRAQTASQGAAWGSVALLALASGALMMWQTRAMPAALMLSVPGATWAAVVLLAWLRARVPVPVAFGSAAALIVAVSGGGAWVYHRIAPPPPLSPGMIAVNQANARCSTLPSLRPIAKLPATIIFAQVDQSPRLVAMTHHRAISGPYHRNQAAILDIHHAFRGTPDTARGIIKRRGATLLLICPNSSEATIFKAQNPDGFYQQLVDGKVPDWLEPVPLAGDSPFKLWRVK